jgi:hypothetical protein
MKSRALAFLAVSLLAGCSAVPASTTAPNSDDVAQIPRLGDARVQALKRIASRKISYDSPLSFYRFMAGGTSIRVSMMYAEAADGTQYVAQVNVRPNNLENPEDKDLSDSAKRLVVSVLLPDRRPVRAGAQSATVQDDVAGLKDGESAALFESRRVSRNVVHGRIWDVDAQRWTSSSCRRATPGLVEVYSERHSDGVTRLMVNSEFLGHCMKLSLD